ncbi:MAG: DUF2946 domain-containing protein [Leptothrix sp. (in: Bacteria)]|nr:DUF2946 domain-containing protein [Leptothrix sp. (in: b-proteobacteria)]MBP7915539.1 DUF2946 domain-containing protein [Vitreoscilla sp.]
MLTLRHHLRRLSWIALLAIFGLAIAPTISRAMSAGGGNSAWAEVCTPQGVKVVAAMASQGDAPAPQAGGLHLDHCPLCGLGADAPLPQAPRAHEVEPGPGDAVPVLFLRAPRPLFAWAAAQPRAPPLNS